MTIGWRAVEASPGTAHVVPTRDLVGHDVSSDQADCVCGPRTEHVQHDGKPDGWLIIHRSLRGKSDG